MLKQLRMRLKRRFCHHSLLIRGTRVIAGRHMTIYRACPKCGKLFTQIVW